MLHDRNESSVKEFNKAAIVSITLYLRISKPAVFSCISCSLCTVILRSGLTFNLFAFAVVGISLDLVVAVFWSVVFNVDSRVSLFGCRLRFPNGNGNSNGVGCGKNFRFRIDDLEGNTATEGTVRGKVLATEGANVLYVTVLRFAFNISRDSDSQSVTLVVSRGPDGLPFLLAGAWAWLHVSFKPRAELFAGTRFIQSTSEWTSSVGIHLPGCDLNPSTRSGLSDLFSCCKLKRLRTSLNISPCRNRALKEVIVYEVSVVITFGGFDGSRDGFTVDDPIRCEIVVFNQLKTGAAALFHPHTLSLLLVPPALTASRDNRITKGDDIVLSRALASSVVFHRKTLPVTKFHTSHETVVSKSFDETNVGGYYVEFRDGSQDGKSDCWREFEKHCER